jgi:hypothetical protein
MSPWLLRLYRCAWFFGFFVVVVLLQKGSTVVQNPMLSEPQ